MSRRFAITLLLTVGGVLIHGVGARPARADVPIVDRLNATPPNFWLCAVGVPAGTGAGQTPAGGTPGMVPDAMGIHAALKDQPGYGAARIKRIWGTGSDGDATVAKLKECIASFAGAAAGDVVVFYISSHGGRILIDGNNDEPQTEQDFLKPGNLNPLVQGRDESIILDSSVQNYWVSDDEFAKMWFPPNLKLNKDVQVVAIFDHCFAGGHADGKSDLAARLPNRKALLMAAELQYLAYEFGNGTLNPFGPKTFGADGLGAFTLYLLEGLELVANVACQGGETTRADLGAAPVNFGQPAPNNDCVTTAAELFHYASQRTAFLVGDVDDNDGKPDDDGVGMPDEPKDADGDGGTWPVANGAAEGVAGAPLCRNVIDDDMDGKLNDGCGDRVAEDPPDFVTAVGATLGTDDDVANNGDPAPDGLRDEDGLGTKTNSLRGAFEHSMGNLPPNQVAIDCENAPDLCRQYPKLIDIEKDPCQGGLPNIEGTEGDDRLEGTPGDDLIYAKGGNDRIDARQGGNDIICAGGDDDKVKTGAGADYIDLGDGNDKLRDNGGSNIIRAGEGNNKIILKSQPVGDDNITAGSGNDKIVDKGGGHNTILTGDGDDKVRIKGEGDDIIDLGPGDDKAKSGGGDDQIAGDSGTDKCDGGDGTDEVADCEIVKHVP